jgi:hypothetical protein
MRSEPGPSPRPPASRRFTSRSDPPPSPYRSYRLLFRIVGIPLVAILGVYLYKGVRDRLVLPECDSANAKQTLTQVFQQLKLAPLRFAPVTTVSSSKDEVVCRATLPLADGGDVVADYTFVWDGSKASMKYSVVRKPPPPQPPVSGGSP